MTTVKISDQTAREIYPSANQDLKKILEDSFGKSFFSMKITDRVKTFEDACSVLGISAGQILNSEDTIDEAAYKKLKVIARALNEGWKPDWNNSNEYKYYPYFNMRGGFVFYVDGCRDQHSGVGSRLCFKNRQLAEYAAKQFEAIYSDYFIIK